MISCACDQARLAHTGLSHDERARGVGVARQQPGHGLQFADPARQRPRVGQGHSRPHHRYAVNGRKAPLSRLSRILPP